MVTRTYGHQTEQQKRKTLYNAWNTMRHACNNPRHVGWKSYGARGITVCKTWLTSFEQFVEDMGPKPTPHHCLDRAEKTQGFSKENCRWSLKTTQMRNYSRTVRVDYAEIKDADDKPVSLMELSEKVNMNPRTMRSRIRKFGYTPDEAVTILPAQLYTYGGVTKTMLEWSRHFGISEQTLYSRIVKRGWSLEKAFTYPVQLRDQLITFHGKTQTLVAWAKDLGVTYNCLHLRLHVYHWPMEDALTSTQGRRLKSG